GFLVRRPAAAVAAPAATAAVAAAAAPTAAIAAPAAAAAAVAAPAAAALLGTGLVHREGPALVLQAVEGGDGRLGLGVVAHLDKAEPLGPAGVAVHDHLRRLDGPVLPEQLLQVAVGHAVGQVAYVQLLAHEGPPQRVVRHGAVASAGRRPLRNERE